MPGFPITRRWFLAWSAITAASWNLARARRVRAAPGAAGELPVVVIGAGLGGLCSAAYLARQGFPVTVLEQHIQPGGYATSFSRANGDFEFEVSLHGTSIYEAGEGSILHDLGLLDRLSFVELPEVYRLKTPRLDIRVPQRDPESYIRLLAQAFPAEAEGIRAAVSEMVGLHQEVGDFGRRAGFGKFLLFPLRYRKMWNVTGQTLREFLGRFVKDAEVQDALAGLWGYYGLPPSRLSAFYYANATGQYLSNGSYYIRPRSQSLSDVLARTVAEAGGRIRYRTEATQVLIEDGAVRGVRLSNGEELPAKVVVSNASAPALFEMLLPAGAMPKADLEEVRGYRPSISAFNVWLGLDRELRGTVPAYATHVHSGEGMEADYRYAVEGRPENGAFVVVVYDNLYAGYSRPGSSTVSILFLCGYEPWRRFEADYRAGRKDEYDQEKARWREVLISRAEEQVIPGLRSMIQVQDASTPLTNWRYTRNPEGAIYGFEQSTDNAYVKRIGNRTAVEGLYLASAWGNPGGGYGGVLRGGQAAAEMIVDDWT
jgi:prolycopene isomerase